MYSTQANAKLYIYICRYVQAAETVICDNGQLCPLFTEAHRNWQTAVCSKETEIYVLDGAWRNLTWRNPWTSLVTHSDAAGVTGEPGASIQPVPPLSVWYCWCLVMTVNGVSEFFRCQSRCRTATIGTAHALTAKYLFVCLTASWLTADILIRETVIENDEIHDAVCTNWGTRMLTCVQPIYSVLFLFSLGETGEGRYWNWIAVVMQTVSHCLCATQHNTTQHLICICTADCHIRHVA